MGKAAPRLAPIEPPAQLALNLHPLVKVRTMGPLGSRFVEFHNANPHVYEALVQLARWCRASGWRAGSINLFFEQLRWQYAIQTRGDEYALNNNFRAFYARLIMSTCPDLMGFFHVRMQRRAFDPSDVHVLALEAASVRS